MQWTQKLGKIVFSAENEHKTNRISNTNLVQTAYWATVNQRNSTKFTRILWANPKEINKQRLQFDYFTTIHKQ